MAEDNKSSELYDSSDRKVKAVCILAGIAYATVVSCFAYGVSKAASRFLSRFNTPSQIERVIEEFGGR